MNMGIKEKLKNKKDKLHINKHVHNFPNMDNFNPKTVYCECGLPCVYIPPTKKI